MYSGDVTDPSTGTVTPNSPWIGWTQTFDAAGRVAADWTPDAGATTGATSGAAATGFSDAYTYDPADRLTQVVDETAPAGAGGVNASTGVVTGGTCVIRTYAFDGDGNRTTKTVIPANSDGSCQSTTSPTGAVTSSWSHDAADRMTNAGYVYDSLGRVTTIPQVDTPLAQAGGTPGVLSLAYFDTDQIQAQSQNGTTISNTLDASGRPLTQATGPTGASATSTTTMGYTDAGDSPSFETTSGGSSATSEAYVDGPDGSLGATLTSAGTIQLAVCDPRGSAVAQITLPSTGDASGLDDWAGSDEYGNATNPATTGTTATNPAGDPTGGLGYGWEGARKRDTDPTGMVQMGVRLYNPTTGTFSSIDPQFGGNRTAYGYPLDPINGSDLTGRCSWYDVVCVVKKVVRKLVKVATNPHLQYGAGFCIGVCIEGTVQGGYFSLSWGGVGIGGHGLYIGYASARATEQGRNSAEFCASWGVGLCGFIGNKKRAGHNYGGFGLNIGDELFGGPMFNIHTWRIR